MKKPSGQKWMAKIALNAAEKEKLSV